MSLHYFSSLRKLVHKESSRMFISDFRRQMLHLTRYVCSVPCYHALPSSATLPMAIHLLKDRSDDTEFNREDPYELAIPNVNFISIMGFENVNLDGLVSSLICTNDYEGIIITSQRAVDSLKQALRNISEGIKKEILAKLVYTVGPSTAQRLSTLQFKNVKGADAGNGSLLADTMLTDSNIKPNSKFLFLAGEVHRRILPEKLISASHSVITKIVYRTHENPNITSDLASHVNQGDWIVFFSPSHTSEVLEFIRNSNIELKFAAIGPTTEQFLQNEGFRVDAIAPEPSPEGLKKAIFP